MINLSAFSNQFVEILNLFKLHAIEAAMIVGVLWAIHFMNIIIGMRLNILGIWPRQTWGLIGIITSPFLHGDFSHLLFNSIPLFLLVNFMLIATASAFWPVTIAIIFLGGLFIWLAGRRGIHIGASGLIMGYWGFLLTLTFFQPTIYNLIVVFIMLYYLGGLVFNLFPASAKVSVEGHIFGALAGSITAFLFYLYL